MMMTLSGFRGNPIFLVIPIEFLNILLFLLVQAVVLDIQIRSLPIQSSKTLGKI